MLNSVVDAVLGGQLGSFWHYYNALLCRGPEVAPTAAEAQRDYLQKAEALATAHDFLV